MSSQDVVIWKCFVINCWDQRVVQQLLSFSNAVTFSFDPCCSSLSGYYLLLTYKFRSYTISKITDFSSDCTPMHLWASAERHKRLCRQHLSFGGGCAVVASGAVIITGKPGLKNHTHGFRAPNRITVTLLKRKQSYMFESDFSLSIHIWWLEDLVREDRQAGCRSAHKTGIC